MAFSWFYVGFLVGIVIFCLILASETLLNNNVEGLMENSKYSWAW